MILPDSIIVGQRIRQLRGKRSQTEVAKALGVTPMAISHYENGDRMPTDKIKVEMARYFGCSVESIFFSAK